jgi:uncharacterized protein
MTSEEFDSIFRRLGHYLKRQDVTNLTIYWVGGEIFVMEPDWFFRANETVRNLTEKLGITVSNLLQSNLIGYGSRWRSAVAEIFNNSLGSSLDFPNFYRKTRTGAPETFNATWLRKYEEAKADGIDVGVIALLHNGTLEIGAEQFCSYYIDEIGITRFQINTPYPGGYPTPVKHTFPLDNDRLKAFYSDLVEFWMRRRHPDNISIGPLNELVDYFRTGENRLSCIWSENCASSFIGISPKGDVGQCEGWIASYPEYSYGNVLACTNFEEIMDSPMRKNFLSRPMHLVERYACSDCDFLGICHGGCTVRAFSCMGDIYAKDPYCSSDKTLFQLARNAAIQIDAMEGTSKKNLRI